jgi:hypothetical protein
MLWDFVAAKEPEAVARMMANPNAVLLNMVFLLASFGMDVIDRTVQSIKGRGENINDRTVRSQRCDRKSVDLGHCATIAPVARRGQISRIALSSLGDSEKMEW